MYLIIFINYHLPLTPISAPISFLSSYTLFLLVIDKWQHPIHAAYMAMDAECVCVWGGGTSEALSLAEELLVMDGYWGRESNSSLEAWWRISTLPRRKDVDMFDQSLTIMP